VRLYQLWLANAAALALFKFYVIPRLRRYIEHHRSLATIRKGAMLSLASWIESILLIAAISGGAVLAISFVVQFGSGVTAEQIGGVIARVQRWRDRVWGFGPAWGIVVLAFNVLALGIYARRRGRIRMTKSFEAVRQNEIDRLKREAAAGQWEDLPPTAEMKKVEERVREFVAAIEQIHGDVISGKPKAVEFHRRLVAQIESLKQLHAELDVQRRLDMRLSPEAAALPEAGNWWEKVQAFFLSQGLWKSLGGPSRAFYVVNLFLLIPSLLGIYSQVAAPLFDQRLLHLTDLQVKLTQREAREAWQQAIAEPPATTAENPNSPQSQGSLTTADLRTLQAVARSFEQALARSELFKSASATVSPEAEREVRSARARETVLQTAAEHSGASVDNLAAGAEAETGVRRQQWKFAENANPIEPVSKPGKQVYENLVDHAKRAPGFVENLKRAFQVPITRDELAMGAGLRSLAAAFGDQFGEFGKLLDGLDPEIESAVRSAAETRMQSYVSEVIRSNGRSATDALGIVSHSPHRDIAPGVLSQFQDFSSRHSIIPDGGDGLIASIREHPPAIDPRPEPHADLHRAAEDLQQIVPNLESDVSPRRAAQAIQESTEALAEYSTHFPASTQAAMRTSQVRVMQQMTTTGGGGAWENIAQALGQAAQGLAQNSRSFVRLRGFSRVGGVLIGNDPEKPCTPLHYRDLRWEIDGARTRFILVDQKGQKSVSRWWRTSIAGQALAYAADGRPLAVTMVSAKPLRELKILIHAALVDTGLGRRITDLDRFVDEFTGSEDRNREVAAARRKATEAVYAQNALYAYAWAERARTVALELKNDDTILRTIAERVGVSSETLRGFVERGNERAEEIIQESETSADATETTLAARGFEEGMAALEDTSQSPLLVKKEFFEPSLVSAMKTARRDAKTFSEFGKNICATSNTSTPDIGALLTSPPEFIVWSGVRERPYRLTLEDFFVAESASLPEALDFMLQVAFTSAPNVEDKNYADAEPWEFPALRAKIHETVLRSIEADTRARAIYDAATEFTLLQRFFRIGFDGLLGDEFPVENFGQLAQELSSIAPPATMRTLRWNARLGSVETYTYNVIRSELLQLAALGDDARADTAGPVEKGLVKLLPTLEETVRKIDAIRATIDSPAQWAKKWKTFSDGRKQWLDRWESSVKTLSSANDDQQGANDDKQRDIVKATVRFLERQTAAMRLRQSLGVDVDDEQIIRESALKVLPPLDKFEPDVAGVFLRAPIASERH
jgi:hypothetical protein